MNKEDIPPSANMSDALNGLGYGFQAMQSTMRPIIPDVALSGPAYPVCCYAGATWALECAIEEAPAGTVLVVDGNHYREAVLMGGLMSLRARTRGLLGAVIDGAVRDISELKNAAWPVFSTAVTPRAGTHAQQGVWNTPITCAGVLVSPGDWVIGDNDGVVIVPKAILNEALEAARAIKRKEQFLEAALSEGQSLQEAVALWETSSSK